jgi:hypothetical protein
MKIGSLDLSDYEISTNISYEYMRTENGEIINGYIVCSINGTIVRTEKNNLNIIAELVKVRDIGKIVDCLEVNGIPNFEPKDTIAKIRKVSINEGDDTSRLHIGVFNIELVGYMEQIPSNRFDVGPEDYLTELFIGETIDIIEDSHGYFFNLNGTDITKSYVRYNATISFTAEVLCSDRQSLNVKKTLRKILITSPKYTDLVDKFREHNKYMESRSLTISSSGRVNFSCSLLLVEKSTFPAFIDLSFNNQRGYENKQIKYGVVGNITGLNEIGSFSDVIDYAGSAVSKYNNAKKAYDGISSKINDLTKIKKFMTSLELTERENCPEETDTTVGKCEFFDENENEYGSCVRPSSSVVTSSTVEGIINFNYDWSNSTDANGCRVNGVTEEWTIDIKSPELQYVEYVRPGLGTYLQGLNTYNSQRVTVTYSVSYPEGNCAADIDCKVSTGLDNDVVKKFAPQDLESNYIIIGRRKTQTKTSFTEVRDFIYCDRSR